jgi:RNA polymerase sigma-70 factor (ECF subfamily)
VLVRESAEALRFVRDYAEEGSVDRLDDRTFEAFYRRHGRQTWARLYRITGSGSTADDLLQRAFLRFLTEADASRSEGELVSFLAKIATNLALDELRKTKRRPEATIADVAVSGSARGSELRQDVAKSLEALEPRERAMLWMAHVDGFSHEEIAAVVSVRTPSVKVLLHRARRKLACVLESMGIGPEVLR